MLYVELPVLCEAVYGSFVVENPSIGTKCIVDAKIDTGSPYTIFPNELLEALDVKPFAQELLETVGGEYFETLLCMGRVYIDDCGEYVDMPIHVAKGELAMSVIGMDILRKGNSALSHIESNGEQLLKFTFSLLPEEKRELL